ncbi:MAG: hypothetical protein M3N45_01110 [Actinomycetota bacterium]|nr:hypothetical protein [Actinomycetota bacterium]
MEDADGRRRGREDYEELDRLLEEVDRSLADGGELRDANEALKRAGVKAASMWGEVGQPVLPGHTRRSVTLIGEVQQDLGRPERSSTDALRGNLPAALPVRDRGAQGRRQIALQNREQVVDGKK